MDLSEIKVGDSIKNKNPYPGEGEYIVAEIRPKLFPDHIKVIAAMCEKYPGLNGHASYLDIDSLVYFDKVK